MEDDDHRGRGELMKWVGAIYTSTRVCGCEGYVCMCVCVWRE